MGVERLALISTVMSVHECCRVSCLPNFGVVVVIGPNFVETPHVPYQYDEGMVIEGSKQSGFNHRGLRERGNWLLPMQHVYAPAFLC